MHDKLLVGWRDAGWVRMLRWNRFHTAHVTAAVLPVSSRRATRPRTKENFDADCPACSISESVPPVRYGGIERVVATLAEELVRRKLQVTLFASGDSATSACLVPVVE